MARGTGLQPTRNVGVLVVDDNVGYADMLAKLIRRADGGLTVDTEASGQAALDALADGSIDCVVSAGEVADSSGLDLLTAVGDVHPGVGCILLTKEDPE